MKVNNPNLASQAANLAAAAGVQGASRTSSGASAGAAAAPASSDDVHLSELVRSLRSLATGSPERQSNLEQIARTYAGGNYIPNPQATASRIVQDALQS
jgi:hypothetical protein